MLALLIAVSVIVHHRYRLYAVLRPLQARLPARGRAGLAHVDRLVGRASVLLRSDVLSTSLFLGIIAWGAEGLGFYYLLQFMHIETTLAQAIGIYALAMLAGVIVHEWGAATALWADAASFMAIAVLLIASARSLPEPETGARASWRERVRSGLEYVRGHATAGRLIAGEAVAILFFTLIVPIEVVYAKETLDSTSVGFGALMATWGVGILIGSWLFARAGGRSRPRRLRTG